MNYQNIKRIFDFLSATIVFLLLSPIFIFITICLSITNNGKPFFFQQRPEKIEKLFEIIFPTINRTITPTGLNNSLGTNMPVLQEQ